MKDGHRTPDAETSSCTVVVSKESICITLPYTAVHDFDVQAADIRNAYLQAPTTERHYIFFGAEFGIEHQGTIALI